MMRTLVAGTAGLALFVGGCSSGAKTASDVALPQAMVQQNAEPSYRVGPFDQLQVNVFGVPELSGAAQVDGEGRLNLPLVGGVDALGLTATQLAGELERAYGARFVRDPSITVQVTTPQSQRLVVSGAVKEPGVFPVQGRVTLTQAVAQAKGVGEYADQSNVVVLRDINGQQAAARFDLREIEAGRMADPELAPGDTVIVDTARARRLIRDLAPLGTLFAIFRVFG